MATATVDLINGNSAFYNDVERIEYDNDYVFISLPHGTAAYPREVVLCVVSSREEEKEDDSG